MQLEQLYRYFCDSPCDINEHLPTLRDLASQVDTVTEFGTRHGVSTVALLAGQPKKLTCYDIDPKWDDWNEILKLRGKTSLSFNVENTLKVTIEFTDLLFIDTLHTYDQLIEELKLHSYKVSRYIALHDTVTFAHVGEDPTKRGLWDAVSEFIFDQPFAVKYHYQNNNGLTVLERIN